MQAEDLPLPDSSPTRRGRPRNPAIEERIFASALDVYAAQGWAGFNFEAVAREAGVGRDALYRRWPSREALLQAILRTRWDRVRAIDHGDARADMLALGHLTFGLYAGRHGEVALQLRADARRHDAVAAIANPYREELVRLGRHIVRRAIDRGELPARAGPGLIMDLLVGAILNHIGSTPAALREQMMDKAEGFITDAVDVILSGSRSLA
ncbi:MAG: TetR/AcrR family transcriptional regulator [Sphingobium sp.]